MSGKAVLLVENDIALSNEVARLLTAESLDVTQTDDCETAFRQVARRHFDATVINVTVAVQPGGTALLDLVRDQEACLFVSPGGELWLTASDRPEQIVLRGHFTTSEFATCIADAVRKVLRTSHLNDQLPGGIRAERPTSTKEKFA